MVVGFKSVLNLMEELRLLARDQANCDHTPATRVDFCAIIGTVLTSHPGTGLVGFFSPLVS